MGQLSRWPQRLSRNEGKGYHLLALLLELATCIDEENPGYDEAMPLWLSRTLREMKQPVHLREGLPAMVRISGKSREHLSREFKRWLSQSPVRWLQDVRMAWSADQLRLTDNSVTTIANDIGLHNMGHFYELYKKTWNCTPRDHRLQYHRQRGST